MKLQSTDNRLRFSIVQSVNLNAKEAAFLRRMAEFCIEHRMEGSAACGTLVDVLALCQVTANFKGPVYGLFEEE